MVNTQDIRERIVSYLDPEVREVYDIGAYIISSGGKGVRPLLTIMVCEALGGDVERVIPLAVGIEYVHIASLLHDDVVDGAQRRRGKKSANLVFGNQACVLTGDYMYAKALSLYAQYGNLESIQVLSDAVMKMSQGQLLELKSLGKIIDQETYFRIIDYKTGALFGACMAVGALMAERKDHWDFYQMGLLAGRAFQLIDDALDYAGTEEKIGKPVGSDLAEGKCTYPLLSVLDKLTEEEKQLFYKGEHENLRSLVLKYGGVEKTQEKARGELERVLRFLKGWDRTGAIENLMTRLIYRES
ncbi:polyprenyl synthetase family protein [Hydrogenobacter sp. T-2]|uniref:polyprenyl synthetase family protein n=1 Tax=Pampinifervens diazotrophicum TaxID=1632018 RepID=UPI002B264653|nr:polyprenyl synthetase family protein [Hydrogenobacter sp. T-2]WPM32376.1 polyprenyl synthetase family protein [Hydrogenobacter sp. T-2]